MKKFWVNVQDIKRGLPHEGATVAVYGSLKDAEDYAYEYMCDHWSGCFNFVRIFDEKMNLLEEFEV